MTRFRVVKVTYGLRDGKMHYEETEQGAVTLPASGSYRLVMEGHDNVYDFSVCPEDGAWQSVAERVDGTHLGSETAGGFVGAYVGVFASGNGNRTQNEAVFSQVTLREEQKQ